MVKTKPDKLLSLFEDLAEKMNINIMFRDVIYCQELPAGSAFCVSQNAERRTQSHLRFQRTSLDLSLANIQSHVTKVIGAEKNLLYL